jgi:hypothetical protein
MNIAHKGVETMAENKQEREIADIQTYPILTQDLSYAPVPGQATTAAAPGGGAPLKQIAENAIRDVLGCKPKVNDPKGIVAALNQSFSPKEDEGHTDWLWTPRSYAAQVDMSAITGAQASLYQRAKTALDQSLPLLDGLYALDVTADPQDTEATRAIVRSAMVELINELGQVGGPRPQRVDDYFRTLLDYNPRRPPNPKTGKPHPLGLSDPESVSGQLGILRDRFGLTRNLVNTIDEEQNLTNYFIIVNYFDTLQVSWDTDRHFFLRATNGDAFLGTQQVLMLQSLAALAEEVQQAYFIFDSLFIGPAERQTTYIEFDGIQLTLTELLEWVDSFASEEAPRLIQDGGKDGVMSIVPTVEKLRSLVNEALALARKPTGNPSRGFHSPRSQFAFQDLSQQLKTTADLADQIRRGPSDRKVIPIPQISRVVPNHASTAGPQPVPLTILGGDFDPNVEVKLKFPDGKDPSPRNHLVPTNITVTDDGTKITASLTLTDAASLGSWDLVVTNPVPKGDPIKSNTLPGAFTVDPVAVLPAPEIQQVAPKSADMGAKVDMRIKGKNFQQGAVVTLTQDGAPPIASTGKTSVGEGGALITTSFDLTGVAPDDWDVTVTNEDSQSDTLLDGFTVEPLPPPQIKQISPDHAENTGFVTLRILGADFRNPPSVTLQMAGKPDIVGADPVLQGGTLITVDFDLMGEATGGWDVLVTNPDGSSDIRLGGFSVEAPPPPHIQQISPASAENTGRVTVRILGADFRDPPTVTLQFAGQADILGDKPTLDLGNKRITTGFDVTGTTAGAWDVLVANPDGSTDILLGGFTIFEPTDTQKPAAS